MRNIILGISLFWFGGIGFYLRFLCIHRYHAESGADLWGVCDTRIKNSDFCGHV